MSAFLVAIRQAKDDGDNAAPVALLRSGYEPTPEEWELYESLAIGSEFQTEKLKRRRLLAEALNYYRTTRRRPMEERIRLVMDRFNLLRPPVEHYCVHARDGDVNKLANRLR